MVVYANVVGLLMGLYYSTTFHRILDRDKNPAAWSRLKCYYAAAAAFFIAEGLVFEVRGMEGSLLVGAGGSSPQRPTPPPRRTGLGSGVLRGGGAGLRGAGNGGIVVGRNSSFTD